MKEVRPIRSMSGAVPRTEEAGERDAGTSEAVVVPFTRPDISGMALLYRYLRGYWPVVALALVLATINQVFSLLDPLIFRHVIDDYATKHDQYTNGEFFRGVTLLLSMAVGSRSCPA